MNEGRDRIIDALLQQHLGDSPLRMERRYARAFAGLQASAAPVGAPASARALRLARAALIGVCASVLFLLLPVESRAANLLAEVVSNETRAWTTSDERRYEVEVLLRRPSPDSDGRNREITLRGNWDMRASESRLELAADGLPSLIRADSKDGAWEEREGRPARRLDSRELWPRWIEDHDGSVAVERMDDLLRLVQRSYAIAFARAGDESPTALRGSMHIVAARRDRGLSPRDHAPGPDEIDLWIDTDRNVVLEALLRWTRGPIDGPRPDGPRPDGPRPDGPPRDGPRPDGPRPDGPRPDGPRPDGPRPDGPPPRMRPIDDDYRAAPGALPPTPPTQLRLRRIEPISFPADHFAFPAR